jgi:regulator of sigma E protease
VTELLQVVITVFIFIFILSVLVVIHELGHFLTARAANIRVHEFGIGFPPRAKVLGVRGETTYTLNWLPIGGFVKLEGEDGDDTDDPRSFVNQPLPTRLVVLAAGVVMNLLLAFAIIAGLAATVGEPTLALRVGTVQDGSPAAAAGIQDGDVLVSLGGERYPFLGESWILTDLPARAGEEVTIGVERDGGEEFLVTTTLRPAEEAAELGALGINRSVAAASYVQYPLPEAIGVGVTRTIEATGIILGGLAELGASIVSSPTEAPPAAGPVGIAATVGFVFWELGILVTLYVAAILSANLAVVNILPFPPLDGGRILMNLIKSVAGTRVSVRAERLTYFIGFVFLFAFLIWITSFDIIRLGGG